jgi:signal peptidase I
VERRAEMSVWSLAIGCPVAAALLVLVALRRCFVVVTVTGTSMSPALLPGDRVIVRRRPGDELQAGRIVVFGDPRRDCPGWGYQPDARNRWMIKRVAAAQGDAVPDVARAAVGGVCVVPCGMLVVLGDSANSTDSRSWGFLPAAAVLGVAVRQLRRPAAAGRTGDPVEQRQDRRR